MKKLLALVLALVMTLGLATVSANAYGDEDEISFDEAVAVMSFMGVFQGNENGDFLPTANLDRASAAKLVAYLDLGKTTAEALPAVKVFNDVPETHWAAKYIAYCADAGYIAGAGDGNFYPASELTGYAFGKMLLCVLGYDAKAEGFEGSSWTIAVARKMAELELAAGVEGAPSAVLTREEAAQYCLNALQKATVTYPGGGTTIVTPDGTTVTTGGGAATPGATLGVKRYGAKNPVKSATTDDFKRPAQQWKSGNDVIITVADEPAAEYTAAVTLGKIYTDLDKLADPAAKLWVDGADKGTVNVAANGAAINLGGEDPDPTGNGVLTQAYVGADNKITITVINTYLDTIEKWNAATADTKENIKLTGMANTFVTSDFTKDDEGAYVLYTKVDTAIKSVVKAEVLEGKTVTSYNPGKTVTAGSTYKLAKGYAGENPYSYTAPYDFYMDTYGFLKLAKLQDNTPAVSSNFVYVEAVQAKAATSGDLGGGGTSRWAKAVVLFIDGTYATVDLKITKNGDAYNFNLPEAAGTIAETNIATANVALTNVNNWFAYTEADGVYNLTAVDEMYGKVFNGDIVLEKGKVKSFAVGAAVKNTNSKTSVVTIADADHNHAVTTQTGLVAATLPGKVLVTWAKDAKTVGAIYALKNPAAAVETITYAYAVEAGELNANGRYWTFAIDGAQVVKNVATDVTVAAGKVYKLTETNGKVTAATEIALSDADVVLDIDETYVSLETAGVKYFANNCVVFNISNTATVKGETTLLAVGDTVKVIYNTDGDIAAIYVTARA